LRANLQLFDFATDSAGNSVGNLETSGPVLRVRPKRPLGPELVVNREQNKFASAHDKRRAFVTRWASKLKPTQLRELMRYASINTTLAYYVGEDVEATADALWEGFVDYSVDTNKESGRRKSAKA
jgi:hypothetical protein